MIKVLTWILGPCLGHLHQLCLLVFSTTNAPVFFGCCSKLPVPGLFMCPSHCPGWSFIPYNPPPFFFFFFAEVRKILFVEARRETLHIEECRGTRNQPPFLQINSLEIGLKVASLRKPSWTMDLGTYSREKTCLSNLCLFSFGGTGPYAC
jgi:hypothetical protein